MKEWRTWELDLLATYKKQPTTVGIVAKLLGRSEDEVREKLEKV